MRLTSRLLVGAVVIVGVNVAVMAAIVDSQLSGRLHDQAVDELTRDAHVVAGHWDSGGAPHPLAHADGAALGRRVTIIREDGVVIGDTDFDPEGLKGLENHRLRPEVRAALGGGVGVATRTSPSRGDDELYVAVRAPGGVVRVSMPEAELTMRVASARRAVLIAGIVAVLVALALSLALARRLVRPVLELGDVARGIAAGDRDRRAAIDAPGEIGELGRSLADLSAQLAARDAARDAYEDLLVQLIETLNEGIVGVDGRRTVVRMNDRARALLGVQATLPFSTDLLPRDRMLRDVLDAALAGEQTDAAETTLDARTVSVSGRPLPGGGGVLALLDLTRLRRLEAVRRDFVANVSHELRTPLTVIGGFAETLTQPDLGAADRAQFAERILFNAKRMQRLVDDLLDLSRIESGGWVPTPAEVDLDALAREVIVEVGDRAAAHRVEVVTDLGETARTVHADPTAVRQILRNLVENAVRHTRDGRVTISVRRTDPGGVELVVRDAGSGIPPEHLPRIFERFYRVDPARSRQEGGTGLGLAIVKHLVEAHGGQVTAESTVGAGTTVRVVLPNG